ncbi:MAG: cobalamin-binding protein [Burkholderiales bacterium]|nr:cobalamin-binding protein [Burkholderiales bacterium]
MSSVVCGQTTLFVVDSTGKPVTLSKPATRVITLAPNATELVVAAGGFDKLVAVSLFSDAPKAVETLPKVNGVSLNIERILAFAPDLIVGTEFSRAALDRYRHSLSNIAIYVADASTPEGIANDIESLGVLVGNRKKAREEADKYRERLKQMMARAPNTQEKDRAKVLYLLWSDPIYTIGGGTLIDNAIRRCGGVNVFHDQKAPAPTISKETVIEREPEIMVFGATPDQILIWRKMWEAWPAIPAVKNNAIFYVDPDLMHRAGPRFIDGMESLCASIQGSGAFGKK